jgi:hypothetical protein
MERRAQEVAPYSQRSSGDHFAALKTSGGTGAFNA